MVPSYHIDTENLNEEIFNMAIKNTPNVSGVYIHRKAFKKSQVTKLKNLFNQNEIKMISSKELSTLM